MFFAFHFFDRASQDGACAVGGFADELGRILLDVEFAGHVFDFEQDDDARRDEDGVNLEVGVAVFQEDVVEDGVRIGWLEVAELVVEFLLPSESRFAVVEVGADFFVFFVVDRQAFEQGLLADEEFWDGARFVEYGVSPPFCMCLL